MAAKLNRQRAVRASGQAPRVAHQLLPIPEIDEPTLAPCHSGASFVDNRDRKEAICDEITSSVSSQFHAASNQQLEQVWCRSMETMYQAQKAHMDQYAQMESQVAQITDASKKLQDDNRALRTILEQAVSYLQALQEAAATGDNAIGNCSPVICTLERQKTQVEASVPLRLDEVLSSSDDSKLSPDADSTNDSLSPRSSGSDSDSKPSSSANASVASTASMELEDRVVQFSVTFRRMDGMPLGLVAKPDLKHNRLVVESLQPGSVVDAWNMQNSGDNREIRRNDRVLSVNGCTDLLAMRSEFMNKMLLKVVFEHTELVLV